MNPERYFTTSRVIIVAGKGGVGKTAVTAALAHAGSSTGLRVLIVEVEGKGGLAAAFGSDELSYSQLTLVGHSDTHAGVIARSLTPDDALLEYLHDHGMKRISKRLVASGALDVVATAVPGIRDILVLGKIKQLERASDFDLVLVDAPAAGHAISFLRSASGLADAVKVGPISSQANEVLELLRDPRRCRVTLVTLAEETPVNELIETAYSIEDEVGIALGPVIVNGVLPEAPDPDTDLGALAEDIGLTLGSDCERSLRAAVAFRSARIEVQARQLERLRSDLPLPQLQLPHLFSSDLDLSGVETLSRTLIEEIHRLPELGADD